MPGTYDLGFYVGRVVSQSVGVNHNGNSYVAVNFQIIARWGDKETPTGDGERPEVKLYTTEKAMWMTKKKLACLGFHHEDLDRLNPDNPFFEKFEGTEVVLEYKDSTDGRFKNWEIELLLTAKRREIIAHPPEPETLKMKSQRVPADKDDDGEEFSPF